MGKATFVQLVTAPSVKGYIVASGVYNDRMERAFVEDMSRIMEKRKSRATVSLDLSDGIGPFILFLIS